MAIDKVFESCYRGYLTELASILESYMVDYAGMGDMVQLSRSFSYCGIANLVVSNDFYISTLYKQINEEYMQFVEDPRIKASYARFLGLYNAFYGKLDEASQYYADARNLYPQTNWYSDEAMALLEAACWYYIFLEELADFYNILERLEILNKYLEDYLNDDLYILRSFCRDNGIIKFDYAQRGELSLSMPVKILVIFTKLRDRVLDSHENNNREQLMSFGMELASCPITQILHEMSQMAQKSAQNNYLDMERHITVVKAKSELFRHPWFKAETSKLYDNIKGLCCSQIATGSLLNVSEASSSIQKVSIRLFKNCTINSGNIIYKLNSFETRKGNELLIYLLTKNNLQAPKEAVIELFFSDEVPEKAYNRLYVNIHRLNKNLRKTFAFLDRKDFIYIKQGIVCINPELIEEIDTHTFKKIISVANQLWVDDKDAAIEVINKAICLYSPEIAAGFYYVEWLEDYRQELKNLQIRAQEKIFTYNLEKGNYRLCSEAFYNLIELDPLNEDNYLKYIEYTLKNGHPVEAANLYERYKRVLEKDLGISPSLNLQGLVSQITR